MSVNFDILNQKGSPAIYSDVFANRPTASYAGRLFISTDTKEIYRDTGSAWEEIAGQGSGNIQGSGTANYVPKFTDTETIGNSQIRDDGTGVGIGVAPSAVYYLDIGGSQRNTLSGAGGFTLRQSGSTIAAYGVYDSASANAFLFSKDGTTNSIYSVGKIEHKIFDGSTNYYISEFVTGNFGVNTQTDAGYRADINGTLRATSLIKSGGTSTQYLMADGSVSTLTNPVTGTGTTNYLPKWTSGSALGNSNLITDASGNIGLGFTPSAWGSNYKVIQGGNGSNGVGGSFAFFDSLANGVLLYSNATNDNTNDIYTYTAPSAKYVIENNVYKWFQAPQGTSGTAITFTQAMTLTAAGRLLLGTSTESTYLLDVNGTGRFSGAATFSSTITTPAQVNIGTYDGGAQYPAQSGYALSLGEGSTASGKSLICDGAIAIGNTVAAAVAVASTHKVTMVIDGTTYYLLATNV